MLGGNNGCRGVLVDRFRKNRFDLFTPEGSSNAIHLFDVYPKQLSPIQAGI